MTLYNIYPILNEIKHINSSLHTSTPWCLRTLFPCHIAAYNSSENITTEKLWKILCTFTNWHCALVVKLQLFRASSRRIATENGKEVIFGGFATNFFIAIPMINSNLNRFSHFKIRKTGFIASIEFKEFHNCIHEDVVRNNCCRKFEMYKFCCIKKHKLLK